MASQKKISPRLPAKLFHFWQQSKPRLQKLWRFLALTGRTTLHSGKQLATSVTRAIDTGIEYIARHPLLDWLINRFQTGFFSVQQQWHRLRNRLRASAGYQKAVLYAQLVRLDKPIGILLLLWPTLIALWIAAGGWPDPLVLSVFIAGVILMRSAGCAINDYADRHIDKKVKRTKNR
ncbi:MAG TPA: hypothetical protein ENJ11_03790, partial [Gammaproteobacteria bacterium]|nr:hypothetical protein [Gammaproteobacteria bacterium]